LVVEELVFQIVFHRRVKDLEVLMDQIQFFQQLLQLVVAEEVVELIILVEI
tara:strand:- start:512 stop:664 length:153 start_codon:yes stop_codon:yes gene_type:complete